MKIALAGNPNSGKTSLFNELTGANQYVGNWPGVTVEKKSGHLSDNPAIELQDLPGIYSLSPYSPEEVVARAYLLEEKPDVVVNVVDATNLERNLYLTTQLLETGLPVVVALNMMDLVEQKGDKIDAAALSRALGCPVIEVSAIHQVGLDKLRAFMTGGQWEPGKPIRFAPAVEKALTSIGDRFSYSRWKAIKLLENDAQEISRLDVGARHDVETFRLEVEKACDDDIASVIASGRYDAIGDICKEAVVKAPVKSTWTSKLDAILTNRVLGLVIFAVVMWAIYYLSIETVGDWGTGWANKVLFGPVVGGWLEGFIGSTAATVESMVMFSSVLAMCLLFPATLRRLHDVGLNGSWLYFTLAPFVLEYIYPHGVHSAMMWLLYIINAVLLLICLLVPGKGVPNRYGDRTSVFCANPFSLSGRGGRLEYIVWFVVLSVACFGIGLLGTATLECSPQLNALITNGIVAGVGAVLGFLPQMAVLFLLLSLLEDCGYMARVAFMMDRIFRSIGLSGKAFIPLLVGMGCGVPGIMATRTIENEKDRRMSIMLTTFVPCGAKLPIIALFAALVGENADIATIAYFAGFSSVILGGLILRKTHMFAGSYTPFVMELPSYHVPAGANINMRAMERCRAFVHKAGTIIFVACAIIWFTSNYDWKLNYLNTDEEEEAIEASMLASIGHQIAPLFSPLGWGEWKPAVATVSGLVAKENVVGTFGVLYAGSSKEEETEDQMMDEGSAVASTETAVREPEEGAGEEAGEEDELPRTASLPKSNVMSALAVALWQTNADVRKALPEASEDDEEESEEDEETGVAKELQAAGAFTYLSALSFMLFNLLCAPCFAACGAIRREMNSARWTWFAIGYMCVWAYLVALLVYQFGIWYFMGDFATGQAVACVIAALLLYLIVRPAPSFKR